MARDKKGPSLVRTCVFVGGGRCISFHSGRYYSAKLLFNRTRNSPAKISKKRRNQNNIVKRREMLDQLDWLITERWVTVSPDHFWTAKNKERISFYLLGNQKIQTFILWLPFYIQQQLTLRVSVWIFLVRLSVWRTNWTDSKTGQLLVHLIEAIFWQENKIPTMPHFFLQLWNVLKTYFSLARRWSDWSERERVGQQCKADVERESKRGKEKKKRDTTRYIISLYVHVKEFHKVKRD